MLTVFITAAVVVTLAMAAIAITDMMLSLTLPTAVMHAIELIVIPADIVIGIGNTYYCYYAYY